MLPSAGPQVHVLVRWRVSPDAPQLGSRKSFPRRLLPGVFESQIRRLAAISAYGQVRRIVQGLIHRRKRARLKRRRKSRRAACRGGVQDFWRGFFPARSSCREPGDCRFAGFARSDRNRTRETSVSRAPSYVQHKRQARRYRTLRREPASTCQRMSVCGPGVRSLSLRCSTSREGVARDPEII